MARPREDHTGVEAAVVSRSGTSASTGVCPQICSAFHCMGVLEETAELYNRQQGLNKRNDGPRAAVFFCPALMETEFVSQPLLSGVKKGNSRVPHVCIIYYDTIIYYL